MAELTIGLVLGVYWRVDLTRTFIPMVASSDASTSFGFGVAVAPFPAELLPSIARWSEKQGAYVVLEGQPGCGARLGEPLQLDLRLADFRDVLSVRVRHAAHINLLESEAFILWLRWLLRTRRHHSRRVVDLN